MGDPDQSIYSWRNADIRNILSFQSDFPEAKILPLEQNYRSSQNILSAAKNVIAKNKQRVEKNLWTSNDKGSLISLDEAYDEEEEARKVIKEIQRLSDNGEYSLSDFAVMYRVNAQSRSFEMGCQRFGVPYQIVGDIMQLIDITMSETGYRKYINNDENAEERLENIQEYRNSSREYSSVPALEGLVGFLEGISLISDIDTLEDDTDSITLITLHQSKGLEFPIVFITGMEEGLLPHIRSLDSGSPEELEEERRLFYVGLTRAEQKLFLTRAFRRGFRGNYEPTVPSRFLSDIPASSLINNLRNNKSSNPKPETPENILDFRRDQSRRRTPSQVTTNTSNTDRSGPKPIRKKKIVNKINISKSNEGPKFQIGDKVIHGQFGNGIVMACDPSGDDLQITVAFKDGGGIKKLLQSLAKLKKH